jgi:putative SOS response-associated peptidase YedK
VPADGFYEWRREGRTKQPFYIRLKNGHPFAFAGLWDHWTPADGPAIESCAILTTQPNDIMEPIHNRMPVILDPNSYSLWLDPSFQKLEALQPLLRPYPAEQMAAYPVSQWVNNPRHDDPQCLTPMPAPA